MREVLLPPLLHIPNGNNIELANQSCRQLCCPVTIFHRVLGIGLGIVGGGIAFNNSIPLSDKKIDINLSDGELLILGTSIMVVGAALIVLGIVNDTINGRNDHIDL